MNDDMVERIPGDLHTFHSIDTVTDVDNCTMFPTEFLNSLNLSGLPEHTLKLKENTVVILLRNMGIYAGHCNGTRYLVKEIGEYRLILHKLDAKGDDKTKILVLPLIPCHYGGRNFPFELTQLQFPLKIVFALAINRAQGTICSKMWHFAPKECLDPWASVCCFFSVWESSQHFCMGRAVTFQRLQGKTGAWKEISQECSVQGSS